MSYWELSRSCCGSCLGAVWKLSAVVKHVHALFPKGAVCARVLASECDEALGSEPGSLLKLTTLHKLRMRELVTNVLCFCVFAFLVLPTYTPRPPLTFLHTHTHSNAELWHSCVCTHTHIHKHMETYSTWPTKQLLELGPCSQLEN